MTDQAVNLKLCLFNNTSFETFEDAFIENIRYIYHYFDSIEESRNGKMLEILGYRYEVNDVSSFKFKNEKIGRIGYDYAEDFFEWMISGSNDEDTKLFADKYAANKHFLSKPKSPDLPDNFNVFYGPRILRQMPIIIEELQRFPATRRAVINILSENDLALLDKDETLEYPCCDSAMFTIRNGKLNMHLHMRSNNMANVAKLDMYLWGRLQCQVASTMQIPTGKFISTIGSAHIFEKDFDYLESLQIL